MFFRFFFVGVILLGNVYIGTAPKRRMQQRRHERHVQRQQGHGRHERQQLDQNNFNTNQAPQPSETQLLKAQILATAAKNLAMATKIKIDIVEGEVARRGNQALSPLVPEAIKTIQVVTATIQALVEEIQNQQASGELAASSQTCAEKILSIMNDHNISTWKAAVECVFPTLNALAEEISIVEEIEIKLLAKTSIVCGQTPQPRITQLVQNTKSLVQQAFTAACEAQNTVEQLLADAIQTHDDYSRQLTEALYQAVTACILAELIKSMTISQIVATSVIQGLTEGGVIQPPSQGQFAVTSSMTTHNLHNLYETIIREATLIGIREAETKVTHAKQHATNLTEEEACNLPLHRIRHAKSLLEQIEQMIRILPGMIRANSANFSSSEGSNT